MSIKFLARSESILGLDRPNEARIRLKIPWKAFYFESTDDRWPYSTA